MLNGNASPCPRPKPSEAEGEKACWSDTGKLFQANCGFASANLCSFDTVAVGTKTTGASPLGALDMSGNGAEWTADFCDAGYHATSPPKDPKGPSAGGVRVHRGGSWNSNVKKSRCSARSAALSTTANDEIGFHCAE